MSASPLLRALGQIAFVGAAAFGAILLFDRIQPPSRAARPPAPRVPAGPPIRTTAGDLARRFELNQLAAQRVLDGRAVQVSGQIVQILGDSGAPLLVLSSADHPSPVEGYLRADQLRAVETLRVGESASITCPRLDYSTLPIGRDCTLAPTH